jgi:hypothetical protein
MNALTLLLAARLRMRILAAVCLLLLGVGAIRAADKAVTSLT